MTQCAWSMSKCPLSRYGSRRTEDRQPCADHSCGKYGKRGCAAARDQDCKGRKAADGTDGQRREDRPQGNAHRPQHNVEREDHGDCRQPQRQPERRAEHQQHDLPRLQLTPWPHPLLCELCKRRISDDLPDDLVHGANGRDPPLPPKALLPSGRPAFRCKMSNAPPDPPAASPAAGAQLRKKFLLIHCPHPPL